MSVLPSARDALAMALAGRIAPAVAAIEALVASGDVEAGFVQGLWRIEGRFLPRDLAAARRTLMSVSEAGYLGAARIVQAMMAQGAGGPRDWPGSLAHIAHWSPRDPVARAQSSLLDAMTLTADGDPMIVPPSQILSGDPGVLRIDGLFSPEECRFLVSVATARFKPAEIFHEGQQRFVVDPIRLSDTAGFPLIAEWPAVHALNRRIAAATATDVRQGETLQLLRYAPGQQYRAHLDAVPGLSNQRVLTALVYLNDDYDGGTTEFPDLGLRVRGRIGDALIFANVGPDGRADPRTRHAGAPVTRGMKFIASRWIRAHGPAPGKSFGTDEVPSRPA